MQQESKKRLQKLLQCYFPEWKIDRKIGEGSYSHVYQIYTEDHNKKRHFAALKWIEYPPDYQEITNIKNRGATTDAIQEYNELTKLLVQKEIKLMQMLQNSEHIVHINEHYIIDREDGGIDLLLQMDLLKPLPALIHKMKVSDAIKATIDICKALEECEKNRIIHCDIKPANIFCDNFGNYLLGDFGAAKELGDHSAHPQGTPLYMPPEAEGNKQYTFSSDIYSLGLVLYEMLNEQYPPFIQTQDWPLSIEQENISINKRMERYDLLPAPSQTNAEISSILQKMCSFDPEDRYENAADLRTDLEKLALGTFGDEQLKGKAQWASATDNGQSETDGLKNEKVTSGALPRNTQDLGLRGKTEREKSLTPEEPSETVFSSDEADGSHFIDAVREYIKKRKETATKKKKKIIMVAVITILTAVILAIVFFAVPSMQKISNLKFTDGELSWKNGGSGPWHILIFRDKELIKEIQTSEREIQVDLMPGFNYSAQISDEEIAFSIEKPKPYNMPDCIFEWTDLQYYQVQNNQPGNTKTKTNYISMTSDLGEEGGHGYQLNLRYKTDRKRNAIVWFSCENQIEKYDIELNPSSSYGSTPVDLTDILLKTKSQTVISDLEYMVFLDGSLWTEGRIEIR